MRLSCKAVFQCVATAILALAGSLTAFANQSVIVDCRQGGQPVVTSGLTSTTKVLQSYPSCTITVSIHGGGIATIFSDNSGTPLANPFTAQNNPYPGAGFFYAANGRYDITISGGGITSPLTFADILLNDPATLTGCSQLPALTGDITSAGGTCATVLPNIASAGTGLKTTVNAKGQVTAVTTAASTDLSDTALVARLNAAANFGINAISGGPITGTNASFSSVADNGETVAGEIAPDVTGRQIGDTAHRWDAFIRNLDVSGSITGGITGSGTANSIPKFTGTSSIGNSGLSDNGSTVTNSENESITGTLGVTGATTLGTLAVSSTSTFAGVATANGGWNVSKVIRDCRTDGMVCNATWNGTTLTGNDDSTALNACLANAYAAGQGGIQIPSAQCRINTTVNDTNKPNLDVYGSNSNEDWSTTTTGQNFGITLTQLLCNTGSTPCWDATGTGRARLKNFSERMANGFPSPSQIGFMFGRDNAVSGTGWITGTGTFCFTEENKLENIWVYADTRPAATAVGTVGVYNVGAEQMQILGGGFIADKPLFVTATNDLGLASPYQTLATGCPASMTEMKIGHGVNLQAWTSNAIDLRGVIDFESEKDTEILNGLIGTNHSSAVIINSGSNVPTNITLQGQDEGFDFPLTLNTSVEAIDARMTAVAPTAAGLIVIGNGITVSDSYFNMPQINGTLQPLFNILSGTATIRGSILYEGKNSGSGAGANNITLTGSTIYAPGLTDGVVNTFKAGSNYAVNDATGMSIVGNFSITNLGIGAGASAGVGVLGNNSGLTGTTQIEFQAAPACSSSATVGCEGMRSRFDTAATSFTVTTGDAIHVVEGVKGAGSTITTEVGLDIDTLSNGSTNFAIRTGNNTSQFGGPIVATSTITPSQTAGIVGTTTNNNANAGSVGEVISSTIATGSSVTLTTGTTANITSVSLTAGDWDCTGAVDYTFGATTSYTNLVGGISTTSATLGGQDTKFDFETPAAVPTATADSTFTVPIVRELLSGTTTVFLVTQGTFTVSTLKAYGTIRCRRMR